MKYKKFFKAIETIPNKNSGGCLLFAYGFYLWLKLNNKDTSSFKIKHYDSCLSSSDVKRNLRFIAGKRKKATAAAHFTWFYKEKEYDSNGKFEKQGNYSDSAILPLIDIELFCNNALVNGSWNSYFNRSYALIKLKKELKIIFPKCIV